MKDCELLEQLRKALENNTGVKVYVPMPQMPASAFSTRDNCIYYSHRAYLHPEAKKFDKKSVFITVEVQRKEFRQNSGYTYGPAIIVSLCEGCGGGWSTYDNATINPQDPNNQDIMAGYAPIAKFEWEGQKITVFLS